MALVQWSSRSASHSKFAAEELTPEKLVNGGAKLDPTIVSAPDAETITAASTVAAGAVTLAIAEALLSTIPIGTVLSFSGGQTLTLTEQAMAGEKSLTGTSSGAIASDETYDYPGRRRDRPYKAGQLVGRTFAERTAGTAFGVADVANDEEIYLTAFEVMDASINNDVTLIRHGTLIYEDKLPGWSDLATATQDWIRANYQCIESAEAS